MTVIDKEVQLQKWREAGARWRAKNREYEKERAKQYYKDNTEKRLASARLQYQKDPDYFKKKQRERSVESRLLQSSKSRARKSGIEHSITLSDIVVPEFCPILNIPLYNGDDTPIANSPSLDRVDNTRGYVKDNIRVISHRANTCKSSLTLEEIERLYLYSIGKI